MDPQELNEQEEQEGAGVDEIQEEETQPNSQTQSSEEEEEDGVQSPFSDPDLAGRSPEEIEAAYVRMRNEAQQAQALVDSVGGTGAAHATGHSPPATPPAEEPEPVTDDDFYRNPVQAIQKIMDKTIEPFKRDLAKSQAEVHWQQAQQKVEAMGGKNFTRIRPIVERLLTQQGISAPSVAEIQTAYYNVVGFAATKGIDLNKEGGDISSGEKGKGAGKQPAPPPQSRASSQPSRRSSQTEKEKLRPLTEEERTIARQQGLSHKEYLELQDMEHSELLSSSEQE